MTDVLVTAVRSVAALACIWSHIAFASGQSSERSVEEGGGSAIGSCVVQRDRVAASTYVATPMSIDLKVPVGVSNSLVNCLKINSSPVTLNRVELRGAMAMALLTDKEDGELVSIASYPDSFARLPSNYLPASKESAMACVVTAQPSHAVALAKATPNSVGQAAALKTMSASLSACDISSSLRTLTPVEAGALVATVLFQRYASGGGR